MEGESGVAGVYGRDRATIYCHGWVFSIVVQFNYSVIGLRSFKNDLFVASASAVSKPAQRAYDGSWIMCVSMTPIGEHAPLGNVPTKSEQKQSQTWKAGSTKGPHMITQCDPTLTRRDST